MISSVPAYHELTRAARLALFCLLLAPLAWGCASAEYASLRKTPKNPLADQLQLFSKSGPKPSPRVMQVLRRFGLADQLGGDDHEMLVKLEELHEREPTAESRYALAELSYIAAVKAKPRDAEQALDFYGAAVTHSYQYLFDHRLAWQRNVFDPEFRGACNLYNTALESTLRLVTANHQLQPGAKHEIKAGSRDCELSVVCRAPGWGADQFARFEFVNDYEVQNLTNQYHSYGLGVPLIAVRSKPTEATPAEKFYPPDLSVPVTAFLRMMPQAPNSTAPEERHLAQLELYDPLATQDVFLANIRVPLESDLSTPLAYFLNKPDLMNLSTLGLVRPAAYDNLRGLYMVQPYEPGKIPVLMVHGLWSSPITWMEMFNDLRSDPRIRKHFQFWFYLYPTGQPFWLSAAQLRRDLAETRQILDPSHSEGALDQMVLVGHSMGGLVSNMQTVESGDKYWNTVSTEPITLIKAGPELKTELQSTFYFHPNRSVKRVVTIGTPHRGSDFANDATRWLGRTFISMPKKLVHGSEAIYRENPDAFPDGSILKIPTSIDSLAPDCPILPILLEAPRPPDLKRHNIVGVVEKENILNRVSGKGDGVVSYESAHLDNVNSEIVVNADHLNVHRHPIAVLEVRRILLEHLNELQRQPDPRHPRVYTASTAAPAAPQLVNPWASPHHPALEPPPAPTYPVLDGPALVAPQ